ncbi:MinD/ParA family protein [Amphibacillus indicireducens]|uniref:Flagellum location/number ATPase FlhG n=1 Tax=Amphibacillus indicireducens TaxID=1076330 RepID=A0ABP7V5Y8_9BACI
MYNDQAASLRQKMKEKNGKKQAKTIAVVSGKGGVGKSNFTINFALKLIEKKKSVLIIDLDIGMGNVDILLGLQARYSIVQMYENDLSIHDIIEVGSNAISYISAGSGLSTVFNMDEEKLNYFLDQYHQISTEYDYIFFDMGAGATNESLAYILAADECILVTTPEPTSMMDGYAMIKHIHNKNDQLPFYLLINRADSVKEGKQVIKRLQKVTNYFLGKQITPLGVLPDDKKVSKAVISQVPFTLYDPLAQVSRAIDQIVTQYLTDSIDLDKKAPSSFITKLKKFIKER